MKIVISIFLSIFILIGLTIAGFGVRTVLQARNSAAWPATSGLIQTSQVESRRGSKGRISYKPVIEYAYFVNDNKYQGSLIAFGMANASAGRGFAERYISKYPKDMPVSVYYNPEDHQKSVLEPGVSKRSFILLAFGLTFALFGTCFATIVWLFSP